MPTLPMVRPFPSICSCHTHPSLLAGNYALALPLLATLVGTSSYSQAGVWLKHAECQYMLNDLEGAAVSYSKVLTLAPYHTDTRSISLSPSPSLSTQNELPQIWTP